LVSKDTEFNLDFKNTHKQVIPGERFSSLHRGGPLCTDENHFPAKTVHFFTKVNSVPFDIYEIHI
jgi:hypothetical protein